MTKGRSRHLPTRSDAHHFWQALSALSLQGSHEQSLRQQHLLQASMQILCPWRQIPAALFWSQTSPASLWGVFTYFKSWNHPPCRDHMRTSQHGQDRSLYLANTQSCVLVVATIVSVVCNGNNINIFDLPGLTPSFISTEWSGRTSGFIESLSWAAGCNQANRQRRPGKDTQVLKREIQSEVEIQATALSGRAVFSGWSSCEYSKQALE